jgi:hypothetical protein
MNMLMKQVYILNLYVVASVTLPLLIRYVHPAIIHFVGNALQDGGTLEMYDALCVINS